MVRFPRSVAVVLVAATPCSAFPAAVDPSAPPPDFEFEKELPASDRDAITMIVMQRYPILAASPGIKYAGRSRGPRSEIANVIFFPHAETRGVKQALQVQCKRSKPAKEWSCPSVEVRRYVKLDTQDFEVRVLGNVDVDGVVALTEATRALASTALPDGVAGIVTMIYEADGSYQVAWGSSTFREGVVVQATLMAGGNAANASDWTAFLLDENGNRAE